MPAPAQYEPISMGVALNAEARSTFLRLASSGSASSESAAHTRPSIELGVGVNAESRRLWSAARISFSRSSSAASASSPPPAAPAATRPLNSATDIQLAARKASLPSASGLLARWNRLF